MFDLETAAAVVPPPERNRGGKKRRERERERERERGIGNRDRWLSLQFRHYMSRENEELKVTDTSARPSTEADVLTDWHGQGDGWTNKGGREISALSTYSCAGPTLVILCLDFSSTRYLQLKDSGATSWGWKCAIMPQLYSLEQDWSDITSIPSKGKVWDTRLLVVWRDQPTIFFYSNFSCLACL